MIAAAVPALRAGLAAMAALLVPVLLLTGLIRGTEGLAGGALGVGLVTAFFVAGKLALVAVARRGVTTLLLPAALGVYGAKVVALGLVLVSLNGSDTFDLPSFAWSIVAGTIGWVGAEVWAATRLRVPFYDPQAFAARSADAAQPPAPPRADED